MNFKNIILSAATLLLIPLCGEADGMMRRARRDAAVLRSHAPPERPKTLDELLREHRVWKSIPSENLKQSCPYMMMPIAAQSTLSGKEFDAAVAEFTNYMKMFPRSTPDDKYQFLRRFMWEQLPFVMNLQKITPEIVRSVNDGTVKLSVIIDLDKMRAFIRAIGDYFTSEDFRMVLSRARYEDFSMPPEDEKEFYFCTKHKSHFDSRDDIAKVRTFPVDKIWPTFGLVLDELFGDAAGARLGGIRAPDDAAPEEDSGELDDLGSDADEF